MKIRSRPTTFAVTLFALAVVSGAAAQGGDVEHSGGFAGVRAGLNHEQAEDALAGTSGAVGIFAGVRTGRDWAAEIELWVPGSLRDATGNPHRDILVGVGAVRRFGANLSRSYLLVGFSVARTQNEFTTCFADSRPAPPGPRRRARADGCRLLRARRDRTSSREVHGNEHLFDRRRRRRSALRPRIRLLPEIRAHLAIGSIIVRPTVGVRFDF